MKDIVSCASHSRARRRSTLVGLLSAVMALPAFATNIAYVSAQEGRDIFESGTPNRNCFVTSPCRTIGHALSVVSPGSTIDIIASGTYDAFAATNAITVQADPGVTATIDVVPTATGGTSISIGTPGIGAAPNVRLRGLTVRVFGGDGIIINGAGTKVSLEGLQVNGAGGGNGINFASGSELRVKDCVVSNMKLNGIQLTASGAAIFMNDVDVHDNGQSGILVSGQETAILERVRVSANSYGVYAASGASVDIRNSTATDNGNLVASSGPNPGGFILDASTASTVMLISKSASLRNFQGVRLHSPSSPYAGYLRVEDSLIEGNQAGIITELNGGASVVTVTDTKVILNVVSGIGWEGTTPGNLTLAHNVIDQNEYGVFLLGAGNATFDENVVTNNGTGIWQIGTTAYSRGNNTIFGNGTNVQGSLTTLSGY
jgi:hypothetical protein